MKKRGIKGDKFVIEKEKDYIRKNQYQKKKMMMLVRNNKKIR